MDEFDLVGEHIDQVIECVCDTVRYTERHNDIEDYDFAELLKDMKKMASFVEKVNHWLDKIHPSLGPLKADAIEAYAKWTTGQVDDSMFRYFNEL